MTYEYYEHCSMPGCFSPLLPVACLLLAREAQGKSHLLDLSIGHGSVDLYLSLLIAIVSLVLVQPLRERVQARADRLFFREKYDAYLLLQKLSRDATSIIHLKELLNMIFEELGGTASLHGDALCSPGCGSVRASDR